MSRLRPAVGVSAGPACGVALRRPPADASGERVGSPYPAKSGRRLAPPGVVPHSPLRRVDARAKLALSLCASAAIMLPLVPLAVFLAGFVALVVAGGLVQPATAQLRRIAPLLGLLLAVDWLVAGFAFALLITLRMALLVTAFTVLVTTTTPTELSAGLECLGVPRRLAFALASAYRAVSQIEREWQTIVEAQRARGLGAVRADRRRWQARLGDTVGLVVPAIVLATQRAWTLTEAAATRGLESPRRSVRRRSLPGLDWALLATAIGLLLILLRWR
jgi:energy-coupling factor transporter transmembrane protein EcfT